MGLAGFALVTEPVATCSHYLTRKKNIDMRAEVASSSLIRLVTRTPHRVRDHERENPHKSEVTDRAEQNAETAPK